MTPFRLMSVLDMLNLPISKLVNSYHQLSNLGQHLQTKHQPVAHFPVDQFQGLLNSTNEFIEACAAFNLDVTCQATIRLKGELEACSKNSNNCYEFKDAAHLRLMNYLQSVVHCMQNESQLKIALILPPDKELLLNPKSPPFGSDVAANFPSVIYEIEEAAKCLALERSTASTMHSIRCLEAGLRAISRSLGIPDPTTAAGRNWHNMLQEIEKQLNAKWPKASDRMSGDGEFFERLYGAFKALKNPYRNNAMHLDHVYTENEAWEVFDLIKGVMRMISSRMDEQGQPLA